jgi:hypothetical protein
MVELTAFERSAQTTNRSTIVSNLAENHSNAPSQRILLAVRQAGFPLIDGSGRISVHCPTQLTPVPGCPNVLMRSDGSQVKLSGLPLSGKDMRCGQSPRSESTRTDLFMESSCAGTHCKLPGTFCPRVDNGHADNHGTFGTVQQAGGRAFRSTSATSQSATQEYTTFRRIEHRRPSGVFGQA